MKRIVYIATTPVRWLLAPFQWLAGRWRAVHRFFTEVPPDEPLAETIARPFQGGAERSLFWQGLLENLNDLRQHLVRAVLAVIIATLLSFVFAEQLMAVLAAPLGDDAQARIFQLIRQPPVDALVQLSELGRQGLEKMLITEPTGSISVFMRVALVAGLALAMPFIVWEIYLFIAPGLMPSSRLTLFFGLPLASLLFIIGILFTYLVMLPTAIPFLYTFSVFRQAWQPLKYFELVTNLMVAIGFAFQMPLIIYTLAAVGWIRAKQLAEQWRIAVIAIAVIAAMVTPTVDPLNMGLVMAPMILLYGFSILGARLAEATRGKRKASAP